MAAFEELFRKEDSDSDDEKITINRTFAAKYQKFKECQELDKLKAKYGDVALDESSSEEEDDDADALTPQLEEDFLKTLSMIKSKDPKIYDKSTEFYQRTNDDAETTQAKKKTEKPLLLKDYERQRLLEKGSKAYLSDSDSDNEGEGIKDPYFVKSKGASELTYNEEQEEIKKSFKEVVAENDEGEKDDLLQVREKSSQEKEKEDQDYKQWLKKEGKKMDALGHYWTSGDLNDDEKFLRDYILRRQFIDEGESIPSYKDIVGISDEEDEDEEELEREEEFERKFNFRYEEPDQEFIKRYPRTIAETVRRTDDKRKIKRKEREERKEKEKDKKKEELKRLKNLKRKEIMEKLEKLKEITGNDKVGFLEEDMDGDFDASKYDKIMQTVFDEQYYDVEDEEKPEFSDDELLQEENWDNWDGQHVDNIEEEEEENTVQGEIKMEQENLDDWDGQSVDNLEEEGGDTTVKKDIKMEEDFDDGKCYGTEESYEPHCEDPNFIMDDDYVDTRSEKKKLKEKQMLTNKNKKRSKFLEALQRKKPVFDPKDKTFEEYFDEYYKLDCEDIIDDMPVRFKYRQVLPNDYGLSTDEILKAEDKELNEWCALKRTLRYNTEQEEKTERQKYRKKARNKKKKDQVFSSINAKEGNEDLQQSNPNSNKGKKKSKMKNTPNKNTKSSLHQLNHNSNRGFKRKLKPTLSNVSSLTTKTQQKKLLKQFKGANASTMKKLSTGRLAAYGLDKRKKKKEAESV